ncbi:MAG: DNA-3-methyladenine glycosylase [SAR324 cluster bacterium]|uniref:Putative 3-methyladenine DNA glycosylase n=1 Tax=SAR324 cluster bacterium TaxID=2024889 RepID=A0A7X9IK64_9DELT|nr:DNA-3-methyladenine glycosylase [SAR324 cluster bacterium]
MKKKSLKRLLLGPTVEVAKDLIGYRLVTSVKGHRCAGMIVETEAYDGSIDEASHSFRGKTTRNSIMFEEAGLCYVYFTYGMHYCVNVVTGDKGKGAAVLIRALEPLEGIEIMKRRRGQSKLENLCNGPAKLCQALGIDKKMLGEDLRSSEIIRIEAYKGFPDSEIVTSKRIGITKSKDLEWRFYLKGNLFVSKG